MSIDLSQVRITDPLAIFSTGFADELTRLGYTPGSARLQLRLLAHLSRWLAGQGLGAGDLHANEEDHFLLARHSAGYTSFLTTNAVQPILGYLRCLNVTPQPPPRNVAIGPVEAILERFRRYLTFERALANESAHIYLKAMRTFLDSRVSPDGLTLDIENLTAADIVSFVVARCPHQSLRGRPEKC